MRRLWIGLLAAVLVIGGADTLAWYWATARLASGFDAWATARRAAGWTVRAGPPQRGGWPFSAVLVLPRLKLVAAAGPLDPWPVAWQADRLILRLRPSLPLRLSVAAAGRQDVGLAGGKAVPYTASRLVAHVSLRDGLGSRAVDVALRGLQVGAPGGADGTLDSLRLHVERPEPDAAGPPGVRFTLAARDIVLPSGRRWPLGRRIASVAAHGTLEGPLPASGSLRARAEAFQRAGGSLHLRGASLRWGPLTASLDASLRLDPALRPEGQGQAMVSGYAQALDTLAANGAVTNDAALAAKAVLSLLAAAPHPGGDETVGIPFTFHDGTLSADGMPLLRLPAIADGPAPDAPAIR